MSTTFNRRRKSLIGLTAVLFVLAAAGDRAAYAQQNSSGSSDGKSRPALEGHCPVCIVQMNKWVPGSRAHQATFNGKTYWFPGEEQKKMFLANPVKYVPALGGDCVVCLTKMKKRVPGSIRHAAVYGGRLYLFPSEAQRKQFLAKPKAYADVDRVSIKGISGCAACDHGVAPIGASNVMGLAVVAADGNVYVVEDAHKLYPDLYRRRFEGLRLEVAGIELKRKDKIVWIYPSGLKLLN